MAKRGRHPSSRPGKQRRAGSGARRRSGSSPQRHGARARPPDLLAEVAAYLYSDEPLDLLLYVSGLLATVDPRRQNPFDRNADDTAHASLDELTATFATIEEPETSALLACIRQLAGAELVRARARRALATRRHPLPEWLAHLGQATVYRAVEMTEPLGDGDDVVLGLRLASGHEFCLLTYIDHNVGTIVKDGFAVPGGAADLMAQLRGKSTDPDIRFSKTWISPRPGPGSTRPSRPGRGRGPRMNPEPGQACRPLVDVAARLMPPGGLGRRRHGPMPSGRDSPDDSSRRRPRLTLTTTVTTGACWISSSGSAPTSGQVIRCAVDPLRMSRSS